MKRSKNSGFTLVELLVVVLIIGILAAVALPQYQKAVDVSRIKSMLPLARAVLESEHRFFLENEYYTGNLNRLDITSTQNCYENGYRCFHGNATIQGNTTDEPASFVIVSIPLYPSIYIWLTSNDLCCLANDSNDNKYHKMCQQAMKPVSHTVPINGSTYYCTKV